MQKHTAPPGQAWRLGAGPFILSGVPPMCSGDLELINASDEKVKVRAIGATGHKGEALAVRGLQEVRLAARLAPRDRARVRAHFFVDPYTPPGKYTAELACGEQREQVVVHVLEKLDVRVAPERLQFRGVAGQVFSQPLVITNRGNVTHTVPELALVHLEERDWFGRSLVYALRQTEEGESHQAYLDRLLREIRATDIRPARVTFHANPREIRPGETREVHAEITLPEKLIKGRTYVRAIPFMSTDLYFEVECNGTPGSNKRRP
ncbi:MAG: hypothetical protein HYY65_11895 [Candidatus Tectomicrobia bacterium]|uniref:Uncharacterized protein n=1 Tax=Tectimicrobiota bacterium TaxID=2528274 RepID=A0A932M1Q6_UNCTE|nr:hypothetical protein [Candidatus Tectomicrobia bacterium]